MLILVCFTSTLYVYCIMNVIIVKISFNVIFKSAFPDQIIQNKPFGSATPQIQKNVSAQFNAESMPLNDPQYLYQNAQCFRHNRELSKTIFKEKSKKNDDFQITNQFLFGCYMPPYYSVLNLLLMEKLIGHRQNPNSIAKVLVPYKDIIEHEKELFDQWLSTIWEESLKNRRLDVIPHIENYIKSVCDFSNNYVKSYYGGTYRSKIKIDYNREEDVVTNRIAMTHCERIKTSKIDYVLKLPEINIKNLESKISFMDVIYVPPPKSPFMQDELCQSLSKENCSDINICLSSIKRIMHLEKANSLWMIPINIDKDTNDRKTINIGGALNSGYFSQEEKSLYYLRKEIKKKFRKIQSMNRDTNSTQQNSKYNYDKWTLKVNEINSDFSKSLNLIIRNKPHTKVIKKKGSDACETVLIPKVEYQPEFGFEKISEDQLVEYWLDTYFRSPAAKFVLVSVQYKMDIMMIKRNNAKYSSLISEDKKQMYLQRLYHTLDKCMQLDIGEYVMLHNPKKPFQVELYQSCVYSSFSLLNLYFVLQQTKVLNSLTWNPIDAQVICPIHEHFKVAPCMFRPNPTLINIKMINEQVDKYKTVMEVREKAEKERVANIKHMKKQKNRVKQRLKRQDDNLYKFKRKLLSNDLGLGTIKHIKKL